MIKVELLSHTPNPERVCAAAARNCYSPVPSYKLYEDMPDEEVEKLLNKIMESGHSSILEHAIFTFGISGVSRVFSHQWCRHRIQVISQKSQRYINGKNFEFVVPPSIRQVKELFDEYTSILEKISSFYDKAIQADISKDDARMLFPNCTTTDLVCTLNARELNHIFNHRCCCYDDKTEVLTDKGWKYFKDLDRTELFYSLNPQTNKCELVKAINYIVDDYVGDMVNVDAQSISLSVTPNHQLYVSYSYEKKNYKLDYAENYKNHKKILMKRNCKPISGIIADTYTIPAVNTLRRNQFKEWEFTFEEKIVDIKKLFQLIGFYLSDGCILRGGEHYNLKFTKGNKEKIDKYFEILSEISDNVPRIYQDKRSNNAWYLEVHDRRLFEFFSKFGKTETKYIPQEFFKYDSSILHFLYDGLSDGNMTKNGECYTTISKQLADDVQRLCLHIGISASIKEDNKIGGKHIIKDNYGREHYIENKHIGYKVNINHTKNEPIIKTTNRDAFSESNYSGKIYCVELEKNHILYVRRNGKVVWSGNSRASWEIREVANQMLAKCKKVAPILFKNAGASCVTLGYCPEGDMCCGRAKPLKEILNGRSN